MAVISHSVQYCRTPDIAAYLVLGNALPGKRSMITYLKSVTNKTQQDYLFQRGTNGRKVAKRELQRYKKIPQKRILAAYSCPRHTRWKATSWNSSREGILAMLQIRYLVHFNITEETCYRFKMTKKKTYLEGLALQRKTPSQYYSQI